MDVLLSRLRLNDPHKLLDYVAKTAVEAGVTVDEAVEMVHARLIREELSLEELGMQFSEINLGGACGD